MQKCKLQFEDHLPYEGNTWHNGQEMLCISNLMEDRRVYVSISKLKQFITEPDPTCALSNTFMLYLIELFSGQATLDWRDKSYTINKIFLRFSSPNLRFQLQFLLASIYNQLDHSYHSIPSKCCSITFLAPRNFPNMTTKYQSEDLKRSIKAEDKSKKTTYHNEDADSPPYKSKKTTYHNDEDDDSPPYKSKKTIHRDSSDDDSPPYKSKKTRKYDNERDEDAEYGPPYKSKEKRKDEVDYEDFPRKVKKTRKDDDSPHYESKNRSCDESDDNDENDIISHSWSVSLFHTEMRVPYKSERWKAFARGDAIEQFFMEWTMRGQEDTVMTRLTRNSIFEPELLTIIAAFMSAQHCEWFRSLKTKHQATKRLPVPIKRHDALCKYEPTENPLQELPETKSRKLLIDQFDSEDVMFFTEIGNQPTGSIPLITIKLTSELLPSQFCSRSNNTTIPDANYIISKGKLYFYRPKTHNKPLYSKQYHTFLELRVLARFL